MIFGRKNKYPLPKFPDDIQSTFKSLCESFPAEILPDLRNELDRAVDTMRLMSKQNNLIDETTLDRLKECSLYFLDNYESLDRQQRALAIGAIRYFVIIDDPIPDDGFSSGLYDDARVMNYVLEQLEIEGMFIAV